jgi:magnesium-transporting ATPase (P-type)
MNEDGSAPEAAPWHATDAARVLASLGVDDRGLASAEASARLARHGPNRLAPPRRKSALVRFLLQFHNVLIYVLLMAGVVTLAMQHYVDAGVIFGVVVVNAIIGFLQEGKAERALDAIRDMLSLKASVWRDGHRQTLAADDLVPGDVVELASGDKVPADLRLFRSKALMIQEAALTGESQPVGKDTATVAADAALGDRRGMAFAGTLVAAGRGTGVVVATGAGTEVGRIGTMLSAVEGVTTPLMRQLGRFGQQLTLVILGLTLIVFLFGVLLHGFAMDAMFMAAVGLAVAAIPEGLPAIVTITLAIGVERMARRHAIIRLLPAVETLGSVDVICSDKTGTLTLNEMMVATVAVPGLSVRVEGEGYRPEGRITRDGDGSAVTAAAAPALAALIRSAVLASDAVVHAAGDDGWAIDGDPTEAALVVLAMKAGLDPAAVAAATPRRDVIPFESEHQYMATLTGGDGDAAIHVKGAPERLLAMCASQAAADNPDGEMPLDVPAWRQAIEAMGGRGERVLAVARRRVAAGRQALGPDDAASGLTLLGLVGIVDPPRADAAAAVGDCHAAGIRVKMITGDHVGTAQAIARSLGLAGAGRALAGADLDRLDDAAFAAAAVETDVFARTTPAHKLRLVQALQAKGLTVAMTGDGVNDAPALKRADVGIAMGRRGTEAAKEAAEIVLADDNFASIAHAVEEGRTVYANLTKAILYLLVTNGAQALTIIVAVVLGAELPITPVQILWVNMVTAVTLALALAFERPEPDVMLRPPRRRDQPLVTARLLARIGFVSTLMVIGVMGLFDHARSLGLPLETARTIAVNALVACEILYLLSVRQGMAPAVSRESARGLAPSLIAILLVVLLQLAFTYVPVMTRLFGTEPLPGLHWGWIGTVALTVFIVVEIEKAVLTAATRPRD